MIRLLDKETREDFLTACGRDPVYGAMNYSRYQCYGHLPALALFWTLYDQDNHPAGSLSSVMGDGVLSCRQPDCLEETAQLLLAVPQTQLLGAGENIRELCRLTGKQAYYAPTMETRQEGIFSSRVSPVQDGWRRLYDFICEGYPYFAAHTSYDHWLSSLTLRVNRGAASPYFLEERGEPLACGIIGYRGEFSGKIGSVVTAPRCRRQGLGREITLHLAAVLHGEGRAAFLHLAEENLAPFYAAAGFVPAGEWGSISC